MRNIIKNIMVVSILSLTLASSAFAGRHHNNFFHKLVHEGGRTVGDGAKVVQNLVGGGGNTSKNPDGGGCGRPTGGGNDDGGTGGSNYGGHSGGNANAFVAHFFLQLDKQNQSNGSLLAQAGGTKKITVCGIDLRVPVLSFIVCNAAATLMPAGCTAGAAITEGGSCAANVAILYASCGISIASAFKIADACIGRMNPNKVSAVEGTGQRVNDSSFRGYVEKQVDNIGDSINLYNSGELYAPKCNSVFSASGTVRMKGSI